MDLIVLRSKLKVHAADLRGETIAFNQLRAAVYGTVWSGNWRHPNSRPPTPQPLGLHGPAHIFVILVAARSKKAEGHASAERGEARFFFQRVAKLLPCPVAFNDEVMRQRAQTFPPETGRMRAHGEIAIWGATAQATF